MGKPRDLTDKSIFHHLSLIPFLAWVGLGADGLSSSSYGPEEAFKTLGEHTYLAVGLALLTLFTVLIISAAYAKIIEDFPHGGGGYVVASKLLGRKVGVISGCALLVDYVLTITVSIAAAGDALFSFIPIQWHFLKLPMDFAIIMGLTTLNIRGVRESVMIMAPIFIVFLVTHAAALIWGVVSHIPEMPETASHVVTGFQDGWKSLGPAAMMLLFVHAYSLGGGTYTGIEAVSNGLPIMREPRVATAKRTMVYMAVSLAATASGLLLCYLLWKVTAVSGKTMNAVFLEKLTQNTPFGGIFVISALLSEGFLLVVAAQAGFIDGPRVLANMAVDSWVPRRFSALSDRLTTGNGILLMGAASLLALWYTKGAVSHLVVMYSINVFLTFSLSIFGMLRRHVRDDRSTPKWWRTLSLFAVGFVLCGTILVITVLEKFEQGGWITLTVTSALVLLCFNIKGHYLTVAKKILRLQSEVGVAHPKSGATARLVEPQKRTAVILVGGYGGLGIHTLLTILKTFPDVYLNVVFVSIGVVDSGVFKGEGAIEQLRDSTEEMLQRYIDLAISRNLAATSRYAIGTDIVKEATNLCLQIAEEFPKSTFFTGKIIFQEERWYQRLLHNETGFALQKRLQVAGQTMVILPARIP